MPGMRGVPLPLLREAIVDYARDSGRRPSLEYALIAGVNDSDVELAALTSFVRGLLVHVNLIPLNPVAEAPLNQSSAERVDAFLGTLEDAGVAATARVERGADIDAACGQLRQRRHR
jgi:23S rRNA (adenine2503-C2)-methyltransferase